MKKIWENVCYFLGNACPRLEWFSWVFEVKVVQKSTACTFFAPHLVSDLSVCNILLESQELPLSLFSRYHCTTSAEMRWPLLSSWGNILRVDDSVLIRERELFCRRLWWCATWSCIKKLFHFIIVIFSLGCTRGSDYALREVYL